MYISPTAVGTIQCTYFIFTNNGVQAHHNERLVTFTHFHSFTLVAFLKEKFRGWRFCGRRLKGMKAREPRVLALELQQVLS